MREADHIYFARRAAEERLAADRASQQVVRETHLEMAERYIAAAAACLGDGSGEPAQEPMPVASPVRVSPL